jgi:hypothetical protein
MAQIILVEPAKHGLQRDSQVSRPCFRLRNRDIRKIDARDLPILLREINRISPLPHAEIRRFAGLSTANRISQ